ncbi:hypothetical protein H2199_006169 [Coniosporium tulheliwenetii]|uniref:Uncharacterized protein n=1 Tax=Coniosporium tulheliwenetii TaxID=3383036 RepID=A0ACC2YXN2_9PEZI|nr:hypothetical protein H2199_006169 [Cladosporium sp. JES 115]
MADVYPDLGRCYEAQETDFTNFGKGPSRPDVPVPSTEAVPSPAVTDHEKCGFCTDESNCVCIPLNQEHQGRDQDKDATGDDDAIGEPDTSEESVSPSHPEPSTSTSDPTLPLTEPTSNNPSYDSLVNLERIFSVSEASSSGGTATTSSDQAMPIHNGLVGCADAFIWLANAQVDINEDWVQSMLAVAPQGGSRRGTAAGEGVGIGRRMTAFDIEGASILATLNVARRHGSSQMSPTNGGE